LARAKTAQKQPAVVQSLAHVDLFAGADAATRRSHEQRCLWQWWNAKAEILGRDAASDEVYFVVKGRVRIVNYTPKGSGEIAFDEVSDGGYFGEMAVIDGEPRSATVLAMTRTLTARLAGTVFRDYLATQPQASLLMMRHLTAIVRASSERIMDLSTLAAQNRIYADLLRQARTGGELPANTALVQPMPRHHAIAARASTARETVARTLADLTRRGLLKRKDDGLVITDMAALGRMVEHFRS
jgi:CRP-like cAMP-binding protein